MVAVVVMGEKSRRIRLKFLKSICIISIGRHVSHRRLKKALSPFGSSVVFAENLSKKQIGRLNCHDHTVYAESVLFSGFLELCRLNKWEKVGVAFDGSVPLSRLCKLLSFCSSLVIANIDFDDDFLRDCIRRYGTCPDQANMADMYSCEAVFSATPFYNFDGVLFGASGFSLCEESVSLPPFARELSGKSVDTIKLAAALSEEEFWLTKIIPKYLSFNGHRFLLQDIKNRTAYS